MTAYVAANWPVFAMAAGCLVLLISAIGFARAAHPRWYRAHRPPPRHEAPGDDEREAVAWLARIRPRPLADARIRVAALTTVIQAAGQPPWPVDRETEGSGDLDQFLPAGPWYPRTLPPLPDEHPSWPGHADATPAPFIRVPEISDEAAAEFADRFREAYERERHQPLRVLPAGDWAESDQAICLCGKDPDIPGEPITSEAGCPAHGDYHGYPPGVVLPPDPPEPSPEVQPGTHARTAWLSQAADPAQAGHLQPLWTDDTGSFAAICAGDA